MTCVIHKNLQNAPVEYPESAGTLIDDDNSYSFLRLLYPARAGYEKSIYYIHPRAKTNYF
jgi:hypothetical protein